MPSIAESLFHEIMSAPDKAARLRAMVGATPPVFESESLDFKGGMAGKPPTQSPLKYDEIKDIWGKALSGFANTGGGVLIWGIDARKMPSLADPKFEVDAAADVRLVPNPVALKSQLISLSSGATEPPLIGVRIESIEDQAGGGFVVCFIPESNFKPIRAILLNKHPYYMRAGESFHIMPTSMLRSLFYPRTTPRYAPEVTCRITHPSNFEWQLVFLVEIKNIGTGTASVDDNLKIGIDVWRYSRFRAFVV